MNDLHPRTLARRRLLRPFDIIIMQGVIYKVRKHWSKAGTPTMQAPTRATIRDIFDAAAIEGETPCALLARLRGADRQWQLDYCARHQKKSMSPKHKPAQRAAQASAGQDVMRKIKRFLER